MSMIRSIAAALVLSAAACAHAHVVLDRSSAPAGSYHKATFMVGHGCDGSATRRLTVFVPAGIVTAKPMARPGWTIQTRTAPLAAAASLHGTRITEAVSQVTWSGGPLPDDRFDEFTLLVRLPDQPGRLHFRVLQECERGQVDWAEIAGAGARPKNPAAVLDVTPAVTGPAPATGPAGAPVAAPGVPSAPAAAGHQH